MIDTDAVRDAFAAIAEEAPPPDRIRASLAGRVRQRRQRRLVLQVAGAGGLAGVAGVAGLAAYRRPDPPAPDPDTATAKGWLEIPFRYRPTWLPDGYGQASFSAVIFDGSPVQWRRDWEDPSVPELELESIGFQVGRSDDDRGRPVLREHRVFRPDPVVTESVDINGVRGTFAVIQSPREGMPGVMRVQWQPDGSPPLQVDIRSSHPSNVLRDNVLRTARSVRRDPRSGWVYPRVRWAPTDIGKLAWGYRIQRHQGAWLQEIQLPILTEHRYIAETPRILRVTSAPNLGADRYGSSPRTPIRIRGLDALIWSGDSNSEIIVNLPDGVQAQFYMVSDAPVMRPVEPDLYRVVEEYDFGQTPDTSWMGSR